MGEDTVLRMQGGARSPERSEGKNGENSDSMMTIEALWRSCYDFPWLLSRRKAPWGRTIAHLGILALFLTAARTSTMGTLVKEVIPSGETKIIEFEANNKGIFRLYCHQHPAHVGGQVVAVISRDHLAQNKRASGRPQDLADLAWLEGAGAE